MALASFLMMRLFRLLSYLPLSWLHWLGVLLGWITWLLSPAYRQHLHANMVLALGASTAQALRSAAIAEAGKAMLELPKIWLRPRAETLARVVGVSGWSLFEAAQKEGKGLLLLTPHLGCFEIAAQYCAQHAPISVLYRPPRKPWLQDLVKQGRSRPNLHLASADLNGVRILLKALRRGETVGILPDQAPRLGEGRWLDFFGKSAYTMTLAARLSETGACVLFIWVERLPHSAGYHVHVQAPSLALSGSTEARAQQINHGIEQLIRQCPSQYLWAYQRYKKPAGVAGPKPHDGASA
ncbi:MAG: lysophospholipid acyltransferase family protein [Pseudomonadota bacterium]